MSAAPGICRNGNRSTSHTAKSIVGLRELTIDFPIVEFRRHKTAAGSSENTERPFEPKMLLNQWIRPPKSAPVVEKATPGEKYSASLRTVRE